MFKNYFIITCRNITRNKVNSFINISGLALGICCVILISFYVQDEFKFDTSFKDAKRIYQVNLNGIFGGGGEFRADATPPPLGKALTTAFPEVETYARVYRPGDQVVRYEEGKQSQSFFTEKNILAADSNFFQLFNYALKEGDAATCLQKPNTVVITQQTAKKYFGNHSPIGKLLLFGNEKTPFIVTGLLQKIPLQSTLQFDMLTSMSSYPLVNYFDWSWVWCNVGTFVKLKANVSTDKASIKNLEAKFPAMVKQQAASAFDRIGQPFDEFIKKGGKWDFYLQPVTAIHLHSEGISSWHNNLGDIKYIYIFSVIALFIIILACVNFMNLSTAQSAKRAKEVGIRKVLGSVKGQLVKQFLTEAILLSFISTIIAIVLVAVLLKPFNIIAEKDLQLHLLLENNNLLYITALALLTGLVAGSYPAFYLTSFNPVEVLKGLKQFRSNFGTMLIRNGLVIFQFTISTGLIICTIIVFKQLQYTRRESVGFNKENVVVIADNGRLGKSIEAFRQELEKSPGVVSASVSTNAPANGSFGDFYVPEQTGTKEQVAKDISISSFMADENFIPTLQLVLLKGRQFSPEFSDSLSVILNETAVKQIGWKEPVGKYIMYPGGKREKYKVIGVVKDFNVQSFRTAISPFALFHSSSKSYDAGTSYVLARVKPGDVSQTLKAIETKWKSFLPNTPFDYTFLDSSFNAFYRSEKSLGTLFGIFTILSIFVACLGLFGLIAYTAERRTKEIGVRKVLGATVQDVVTLLSKDLVKLVIIASVIAFPIAGWAMNKWLQDFIYRTDISWWIFLAAGAVSLVIALLTVSFQAIKAAMANPVKSLRTE
jgi:putative ABC transport system permease protein